MIPAGYIDSLVAWATRPDLADAEKTARQAQFLTAHDALVTGTLEKAGLTMTSGSANGKSFTFAPGITAEEKLVVITAILNRLELLDAGTVTQSAIVYGDFSGIAR